MSSTQTPCKQESLLANQYRPSPLRLPCLQSPEIIEKHEKCLTWICENKLILWYILLFLHFPVTYDRKVKSVHSVWKLEKKSHSTLRAKRATFTFWGDKSSLKMPKMANFATLRKSEAYGQTVLPESMGQKIGGKCHKFKIQMWHFKWFLNTIRHCILTS